MLSRVGCARQIGRNLIPVRSGAQAFASSPARRFTTGHDGQLTPGAFHLRGEVLKPVGLFRSNNTLKAVLRLHSGADDRSYTVTLWGQDAIEAFETIQVADSIEVRGTFAETGETHDDVPTYYLKGSTWAYQQGGEDGVEAPRIQQTQLTEEPEQPQQGGNKHEPQQHPKAQRQPKKNGHRTAS